MRIPLQTCVCITIKPNKIVHNSISIIKTTTLLYKKKIYTKINND